jgi:sialic acid synthase
LAGNNVKAIGYSCHNLGIAINIGARVLGATWHESHVTLGRHLKGTDHACSLEPDGARKLVRDLHAIDQALTFKTEDILEIEVEQRRKLKRL